MESKTKLLTNEKIAMKVSKSSIIVNVLLSTFKLAAGLIAHSGAMVSDAIHSASDVFSTIIVMVGVKISNKAADEQHPYGHERLECVASILLAVILCGTGLGIGYTGIMNIASGEYESLSIPGVLALIAACLSIAVKEGMYWYTRKYAKIINSTALMADAWHHRSDALSSIGSLVGVFGARHGYPVMDSLASIVICIFIVKASGDIFMDSIRKLTDESCDEAIVNKMSEAVLKQEGVERLDLIRTRKFGSRIYVDIEISAEGNLPLTKAHGIAEDVHSIIEHDFPTVKHCMVHVNPMEEEFKEQEFNEQEYKEQAYKEQVKSSNS